MDDLEARLGKLEMDYAAVNERTCGAIDEKCTQHALHSAQFNDIKGYVGRILKLIMWILGTGLTVIIALMTIFLNSTSNNTRQLVLINERQQEVLKWKDTTEGRINSHETALLKYIERK
jgi:hypothetical protein